VRIAKDSGDLVTWLRRSSALCEADFSVMSFAGDAAPARFSTGMFNSGEHSHRRRHKPAAPDSPNPLLATREKDKERFYLLPGMGGKAYRRKRNLILKSAITVGLIVSGVFALVVYLLHHSPK